MWNTIVDNMNHVSLICTAISIIVTIVSIVLTIITWTLKNKTVLLYNTIDLKSLIALFDSESSRFKNKTRNQEWFKGVDPDEVINPFSDILSKFPSVYSSVYSPDELKIHVDKLNDLLVDYPSASSGIKREANSHISKISEILHASLHQKVDSI